MCNCDNKNRQQNKTHLHHLSLDWQVNLSSLPVPSSPYSPPNSIFTFDTTKKKKKEKKKNKTILLFFLISWLPCCVCVHSVCVFFFLFYYLPRWELYPPMTNGCIIIIFGEHRSLLFWKSQRLYSCCCFQCFYWLQLHCQEVGSPTGWCIWDSSS